MRASAGICLAVLMAANVGFAESFVFQQSRDGALKIVSATSAPIPAWSWAEGMSRGPGGLVSGTRGWLVGHEGRSFGSSPAGGSPGGSTTGGTLVFGGTITRGPGVSEVSWSGSGIIQTNLFLGSFDTWLLGSVWGLDSGLGFSTNVGTITLGATGESSAFDTLELAPRSSRVRSTPEATAVSGVWAPQRVAEASPGVDVATQAPYSSVGLVRANSARATAAGSGVVAQDPRLVFTCAHLLFHKGRWAESVAFRRAWDSEYPPDDSATVFARGFYYFSGYTANKRRLYDYDIDFAVAYAKSGETFGPSALSLNTGSGADPDGANDLTSNTTSKMVVGYPFSFFDSNLTRRDGYYYMHQTGPFAAAGPSNEAFFPIFSTYFGMAGVSSGPGHNGGPLLVLKDGSWCVAGIVVAGGYDGTGVAFIDSYAKSVAAAALSAAVSDVPDGGTLTLSAAASLRRPLVLADGVAKYSTVKISFSRVPGWTTRVLLDLNITAAKRGDLDVFVRSPSGRVYQVASPDPNDTGADLVLASRDVSSAFSRALPNGAWTIFARDAAPNGARAQVNSAGLTLTSL